MLRGINRQRIFEDDQDRFHFMTVMQRCKDESRFILHAFCLMPNHVHLIVVIGGNVYNTPVDYLNDESLRRIQCVSTTENTFSPQSKNLASVIRGIKTVTTSFALNKGLAFGWQSRFHDHIVRDIDELNAIANYIENNVANWKDDEFYTNK